MLYRSTLVSGADFNKNMCFFMLYRSIWVSGADVIKIMDFLTEEKLRIFLSENIVKTSCSAWLSLDFN